MSLTLTEIQALTDDVWFPDAQNQWQMGNVLMFKFIEKMEKIGSCEKIRQVLEYSKSRGGAMGASTIFDTAKKVTMNAARYDWARFWTGVTIDHDDEIKVSGGDADVDLVMTKLDNAQATLRDIMGDSLWMSYSSAQTEYGGETDPFYGLEDLMTATGSYGGIAYTDLGTFTREGSSAYIWAPFADSTARTMNFATMQYLRRNCKVGSGKGEKPDLYVTTEALKDAFENSLQAAQRHNDAGLTAAGFDNVLFGGNSGAPVVADDKCTASYVNGLNMNRLYLKAHKDFSLDYSPQWKIPTNQYVKTTQFIFAGAFCCSERRAHGRLTSVS